MGRPYSAGLLGVGSVKCEGREGGGGVPEVSRGVAILDVSLWEYNHMYMYTLYNSIIYQ